MKQLFKFLTLLFVCILAIVMATAIGSVNISMATIINILGYQLFQVPLGEDVTQTAVAIVLNIRMPRTLMAFVVGAALAVSGTVMQSLLRNPLASTYTLGVSSGASLGAAFAMVLGIQLPLLGLFTLPLAGFLGGFGTVLFVMSFSARLDKNMSNQTIILMGMIVSLFINGLLTVVTAFSRQYLEKLVFWQMGSFAGRSWTDITIVFTVSVLGIIFLMRYAKELDLMTFGEEQALSVGVEVKRLKLSLMGMSALLTGVALSFVGIIGFVDLMVPHLTRKLFGSAHHWVLPASALLGGALMVLADLISRTIVAPSELPIGAVTALLGAPFFAYIYFYKGKGGKSC